MRYSPEHKAQTREKLLTNSAALAKQGGFATTGVDALMKAIGLSGGAFYAHFASKEALFKEIVSRELKMSLARMQCDNTEQLTQRLAEYLSLEHVANVEGGCPLPALGDEIIRAGDDCRRHVQQGLNAWHENWAEVVGDENAWAVISQCVGALVLARMFDQTDTQKHILDASKALLNTIT